MKFKIPKLKKPKIKFNPLNMVLTLFFITFIIPQDYALPYSAYKLWWLACCFSTLIAVIGYLIFCIRKIKLPYAAFAFFCLWFYIGTAVFSKDAHFFDYILYFIRCFGFITALEVLFNRYPHKTIVKNFLVASLFMSILHFISYILYSDEEGGMRHDEIVFKAERQGFTHSKQNWFFLTYDNESIYLFLFFAAVFLYYAITYNKKLMKFYWLYIAFILYMFVSKMAATAMIGLIVYIILTGYILLRKKNKPFPINYYNGFAISSFFSLFMITIVGSKLANTIANYFGKDASFSGRDVIWRKSLYYIAKSPLVGNGLEDSSIRKLKLGTSHCHNIFLELLFDGGIIALILFVIFIFLYRPKNNRSVAGMIFTVTIFCYLFTSGVDWLYTDPIPLGMFVFSYYLTRQEENPLRMQLERRS